MKAGKLNPNTLSNGNAKGIKSLKCPNCGYGVKITYISTDITKAVTCECLKCDFITRICRLKKEPPWVCVLGNETQT